MTRPNILMLVVDQERTLDSILSLVPDPQALLNMLPAHQWLQQNGVTFANHYASGIPCSPARSSIYTGFHAPDTQIINVMEFMTQSLGTYNPANPGSCDSAMPTLGAIFSTSQSFGGPGYYCAYKGKVHFALDKDLPNSDALESRYNFSDWTQELTPFYDFALSGFSHDEAIALDAVQWLGTQAPQLAPQNGQPGTPWLLAVNLINPHDVQYAQMDPTLLPPGLGHTGLGIALIPASEPYFNWWNPNPPPNFGPPPSSSNPRPYAVDGFAGILSVGFGNIPFSDANCVVWTSPSTTMQVPMWQAYLNYYINCIVDVDAKMWAVIQALIQSGNSGVDLGNTWIVYLSDHGEMAMSQAGQSSVYAGVTDQSGTLVPVAPTMMPLRSKGSLQFEEAAHVPLIFAAPPVTSGPSVLPGTSRNTTVTALSSHIDIVPTLLDLGGTQDDWYQNKFGTYLGQLDPPISGSLPGMSLAPILANPGAYANILAWNGRSSVLITGDALDTFDPLNAWAITAQDGEWGYLLPDLNLRAMMRAMVTVNSTGNGLMKFGRWFAGTNYSQQAQVTGSYSVLSTPNKSTGYLGQDVQVFDLRADPAELTNLATALSDSDFTALSETLQALMTSELSGPGRIPNETQLFLGILPKCYGDSAPQLVSQMLKRRQASSA